MRDDQRLEEAVARGMACLALRGQKRKHSNEPLICHVQRVAERAASWADPLPKVDASKVHTLGWLHEIIEDGGLEEQALAQVFGSEYSVQILMLTRVEGESYTAYIDFMCKNGAGETLLVKLADLEDNLGPGCPDSLRERYVIARDKIEQALHERGILHVLRNVHFWSISAVPDGEGFSLGYVADVEDPPPPPPPPRKARPTRLMQSEPIFRSPIPPCS